MRQRHTFGNGYVTQIDSCPIGGVSTGRNKLCVCVCVYNITTGRNKLCVCTTSLVTGDIEQDGAHRGHLAAQHN